MLPTLSVFIDSPFLQEQSKNNMDKECAGRSAIVRGSKIQEALVDGNGFLGAHICHYGNGYDTQIVESMTQNTHIAICSDVLIEMNEIIREPRKQYLKAADSALRICKHGQPSPSAVCCRHYPIAVSFGNSNPHKYSIDAIDTLST